MSHDASPESDLQRAPQTSNTEGPSVIRDVAKSTQDRRSQRFRGHRLSGDVLPSGDLVAFGRHPGLGLFEASVENVSVQGAALVFPASTPEAMLLSSDRVHSLRIEIDGRLLFSGSATIQRVGERDGRLVLGVEFEASGLELGLLYGLTRQRNFEERFEAARSGLDDIPHAYKTWVYDLEAFLDGVKRFLDAEEAQLAPLDRQSRLEACSSYRDIVAPIVVERLNRARDELAEFVEELDEEAHERHRQLYRERIGPHLRLSPFMRRALEKPLGYAGDYEMMNMLYRDHAEGQSIFAQALNLYVTQEPAAVANINRLEYLGTKLRVAIQRKRGERVRVASIGCGPAREISRLLEQSPELGPYLDIALVDQEHRVIEFGERTLAPLATETGARVEFLDESVRRLLTARALSAALGQRDLIYSAGLFDYLNTRSFNALLGALYESVVEGGELLVGNVAAHNPTRWWMEYGLDWFLLHRTPEELMEFADRLEPAPSFKDVESEPLGVNLFLTIRR